MCFFIKGNRNHPITVLDRKESTVKIRQKYFPVFYMMVIQEGTEMDIKEKLTQQAEKTKDKKKVTLTKSMSIADLICAMEPEIKKALPSVVTPERFTRMALSALNTKPKLRECTQMSFLAALMNAAQLGLEPNTSLGQAYLIPYNHNGILECQFLIGYKGLIDLVYRNEMVQIIQAHCVYKNDEFSYELGLELKLIHKPVLKNRGELKAVYAMFRLQNGGCGFEVMSKEEVDLYARCYSQSINSDYSPWKTNYEEMAKKTAIKRVLKYAPVKAEFVRAMTVDHAIQNKIGIDMSAIEKQQPIIEGTCQELEALEK